MKILIVAHESEFIGGANRALWLIIKYFHENKMCDMEVLLPQKSGDLVNELNKLNIPCHFANYNKVFSETRKDGKNLLRYLNMSRKHFANIKSANKVSWELKKHNFDAIYSNTRMTSFGWLLAKKMNLPHIIHIREFGNENTVWGPNNIKNIANNSKKIIAITHALKKNLLSNLQEDIITASHDGVRVETTPMKESDFTNNNINILLTGRITDAKGHVEAVKALNKIMPECKRNITLHFAGSIISQSKYGIKYKEEIDFLIKEFNLEKNIVFHGEVKDMTSLRKNMDIELMCAKCETFGWVTVEGMRTGLLLIGTNTGGTPEIIEDNVTGLLYQQGSYKDLANKLMWVFDNPDKATQIAKSGYEFANNNFTIEKNAEEVYNVIKSCIN